MIFLVLNFINKLVILVLELGLDLDGERVSQAWILVKRKN